MNLRPVRFALAASPLLATLWAVLTPGPVSGWPAFSAGNAGACAQCHRSFAELNREGMRFLQAGYRRPGEAASEPRSVRLLALSVVGDLSRGFGTVDSAAAGALHDRDHSTESRQGSVGVHAAGELFDRATFHVEGRLPTHGGAFVADNALVQVQDLAPHGALNLKLGDCRVRGLYLDESHPARLGAALPVENLPARGLELNGSARGWTYGAGVLESWRSQSRTTAAGRVMGRLEDPYVWLIRDLGGQRVGARMLFDRQDSNDLAYLAWMQHLQAQASAVLKQGRLDLLPAYTFDRFDDRPSAGLHQRRQTFLMEAHLPLDAAARWRLTAYAEHDYTTPTVYTREADHHQEALELGLGVRQNAELAVEWLHTADNIGGPQVDNLNTFLRFAY
jgi:hypothetical protein